MRTRALSRLLAATVACVASASALAEFVDPLDSPAPASALAERRLLNAVTATGKRLVAVGQRGHIVYSDDGGTTWTQAAVPLAVDLTSVQFVSADRGWAVGHGGAVIATADGGRRWVKQLDVRRIAKLLADYRAQRGVAASAAILRQIEILTAPGSDASLLDVWFADERTGFVVGAFNLLMRTDDGGESWTPWLDRSENPEGLHLYAVRRVAGDVYVVGERGLVLRLDAGEGRFRALPAPYAGSFFGITGNAEMVIAYGLRGHAFRSRDRGASWEEISTGADVAFTGAAVMPDGRIVLVTQAGQALVSASDGQSFRVARMGNTLPASSVVAAGADAVVLAGTAGVRVEMLH